MTINSHLEVGQFRQALDIFTEILIAISIDLEIGQHHYNNVFERFAAGPYGLKATEAFLRSFLFRGTNYQL